jgi:hypothetical protein
MSIVEEQTYKHNVTNKSENKKCALEHMAELERQRIASEKATQQSVKAAWEWLRSKRTNKVLHKIPVQLQQN